MSLQPDERRLLLAMRGLGEQHGDFLMGARVLGQAAGIGRARSRDLLNDLVLRGLVRRWQSGDDGPLYGIESWTKCADALGDSDALLQVAAQPRQRLSGLAERLPAIALAA